MRPILPSPVFAPRRLPPPFRYVSVRPPPFASIFSRWNIARCAPSVEMAFLFAFLCAINCTCLLVATLCFTFSLRGRSKLCVLGRRFTLTVIVTKRHVVSRLLSLNFRLFCNSFLILLDSFLHRYNFVPHRDHVWSCVRHPTRLSSVHFIHYTRASVSNLPAQTFRCTWCTVMRPVRGEPGHDRLVRHSPPIVIFSTRVCISA